jgi:hypothetical protein
LFIVAIGVGDDLGQVGIGFGEQVLVVDQIRLIRIIGLGGLIGIGNERSVEY